jgi:hypothetical protein
LGPVALPSPLKSPPCTLWESSVAWYCVSSAWRGRDRRGYLGADITRGESPRLHIGQFPGPGAVLAENAIQQKMLEVQRKMLFAVNKTNDQLEKVEFAIRRQRVLPPTPPSPAWNRYNRPYSNRRNFIKSPTPDLIKLKSVVRRRSESPPSNKPRKH